MAFGLSSNSEDGSDAPQSLLIPPNPAIVQPGSSPVSRGGILLNPVGGARQEGAGGADHLRAASRDRARASINGSTSSIATTSTSGYSDGSALSPSSSSISTSPKLKFAPLPTSGRPRSSSIALGVASRASMLSGTGYGPQAAAPQPKRDESPGWQQQCAPVKPMWYAGQQVPENVKTVKDIKPGLKKAWGKIRRRSSSSNSGGSGSASTSRPRSESMDSNASSVSTTSDMSAADEAGGPEVSDNSSLLSSASSTISEEDESEAQAGGEQDEALVERGRSDRMSPVHAQRLAPGYLGYRASTSPEGMHEGGTASGEATPRRRHSPPRHSQHHPSHPQPHVHAMHVYNLGNQGAAGTGTSSHPGSGASTPRRRMSLSDMQQPQAHARHSQAVFGFDEKLLNSKFERANLGRNRFQEGVTDTAHPASPPPVESASDDGESESDVPIPDSNQVRGAAREVAV